MNFPSWGSAARRWVLAARALGRRGSRNPDTVTRVRSHGSPRPRSARRSDARPAGGARPAGRRAGVSGPGAAAARVGAAPSEALAGGAVLRLGAVVWPLATLDVPASLRRSARGPPPGNAASWLGERLDSGVAARRWRHHTNAQVPRSHRQSGRCTRDRPTHHHSSGLMFTIRPARRREAR
jgi:hypothetical protein